MDSVTSCGVSPKVHLAFMSGSEMALHPMTFATFATLRVTIGARPAMDKQSLEAYLAPLAA